MFVLLKGFLSIFKIFKIFKDLSFEKLLIFFVFVFLMV